MNTMACLWRIYCIRVLFVTEYMKTGDNILLKYQKKKRKIIFRFMVMEDAKTPKKQVLPVREEIRYAFADFHGNRLYKG